MQVTAVEPQWSYTVETESRSMHYVSTFTFAPAAGGGTEVTLSFVVGAESAGLDRFAEATPVDVATM